MDTSEKYIKMCEKAQEIQQFRKLDNGEGSPYLKEGDCFCKLNSINVELFKNKTSHILTDIIWLPCQDQLQDLWVEEEEVDYHYKLKLIFDFSWETPNPFNKKKLQTISSSNIYFF